MCVGQCPDQSYSPLHSSLRSRHSDWTIKTRMREFCSSLLTEDLLLQLSVAELVERKLCPAWYLASRPVMGRCLPVLQNNTEDLVRPDWQTGGLSV